MGPNDFATEGEGHFELPQPDPKQALWSCRWMRRSATDRNTVVRIIFSNRAGRKVTGIPTRALLERSEEQGLSKRSKQA